MTIAKPVDPVSVVVHIPGDLLHRNDEAVDGRILVHSGLTDSGHPAGCPGCGARVRVMLPPGRWLLWCNHAHGWQWRPAPVEQPTGRAA